MKTFIKKYLITLLIIGGIAGYMTFHAIDYTYSAGYGQSGKTSKYDKGANTEKLTIPSGVTAVFTPAKLSTVDGNKTTRAAVQIEGADIRITWDGTPPTATLGLKITDGSWFQIVGDVNITNFEAYGLTGTATAYIMYETEAEMNKTTFGE